MLVGVATVALFVAEVAFFSEAVGSEMGWSTAGRDFVAYGLDGSTLPPRVFYSGPFVTVAALVIATSLTLLFAQMVRWRPGG